MSDEEHFYASAAVVPRWAPAFLHTHDYFEVILILSGEVDHFVGGDVTRLKTGHLIFIRPDDTHALRAAPDAVTEGETGDVGKAATVLFRRDLAAEIIARHTASFGRRFFWATSLQPETCRLGDRDRMAVASAFQDLQRSHGGKPAIEAFLLGLLNRAATLPRMSDPATPDWLFLACQAARDPEVFRDGAAGFVRAAGRGHEHVSRSARRYLSLSPSAYVNDQRMDYAAALLKGSDQSIQDICTECGIENLSHFYRLFRARFGDTPRRYRERNHRRPLRAS